MPNSPIKYTWTYRGTTYSITPTTVHDGQTLHTAPVQARGPDAQYRASAAHWERVGRHDLVRAVHAAQDAHDVRTRNTAALRVWLRDTAEEVEEYASGLWTPDDPRAWLLSSIEQVHLTPLPWGVHPVPRGPKKSRVRAKKMQ